MNQYVIYVYDKAVADKIASHGFSYVKEDVKGVSMYRFISCLGLIVLLNSEFNKKDYLKRKYVNFENGGVKDGEVCEV